MLPIATFSLCSLSVQSFLSRFDLISYVPTDAITGYHETSYHGLSSRIKVCLAKTKVRDKNINRPRDFVNVANYVMENFPPGMGKIISGRVADSPLRCV